MIGTIAPTTEALTSILRRPLRGGDGEAGSVGESMTITLGPFDLSNVLARGGMGVVFRATHRAEGAPAAVKVIAIAGAAPGDFYEDFRREVQAAAQLTHPGIVTLYDYGTVPEEAAAESGGKLVAGSPYLAMELIEGGSLAQRAPSDFATLRRQLLELLAALAHAHAHGLVHRDLKPPNVLVTGANQEIKLVDFGIAHASDRRAEGGDDLETLTGTCSYMAPEQIGCSWRDYGPWTDLYALGIMAWELASGRKPFDAPDSAAVLMMHLDKELPDLAPRFGVPDELDGWIRRLCRKRHEERFQCAADAAVELASLDAVESTVVSLAPLAGAERTVATGAPIFDRPLRDRIPITIAEPLPSFPSVPDDWRGERVADSPRLLGAGLGLYFLRTVALIDRERERDALWGALRACGEDGSPRAISLRGPTGTGKSRLAAWLAERAREMGAAIVLCATHDASPGPAHGIARMLAMHYGALGLRGNALVDRMSTCVAREGSTDDLDGRVAAALIDERSSSVRFETPIERYTAVEGVLARKARERTVIVWIDDAQWAGDALGLLEHALDNLAAPVLFVLTVRDEALSERPLERARLETIEAHPRAASCAVAPLSEDDTGLLVESLLGLSGPLAGRLRARVAGNPLFAVQLIGDWVQRGVLQLTREGFALPPGEPGHIPDDLHTVWIERVDRVLAGRPPGDREVLELAATLGSSVDADELEAACALLGHATPPDLFDALTRASLCTRTDAGWMFVHGMLRESLLRASQSAGRAASLHRICVRMLEGRAGRGVAGRRAHHLAEAGELADALDPMLEAARELQDECEFPLARAMLQRREEALARLDLPPSDVRWGLGWVARAEVLRLEWDFEAARAGAENALEHAARHGWRFVRARAFAVLGHCARQQGDLDRADEYNRHALSHFVELGDDEGRVRTLLAMAIVARQRGAIDRAEEMYARAYAYFEMLRDERGAANALLGMAHVARHRRAYDEAEAKYDKARVRFEHAGYRTGVADCVAGIGDLARYRGDFESADAAYREALRLQIATGSKGAVISRLNLTLVFLGQGLYREARRALEAELGPLEREGKRAYLGWAHTILLACVTEENDLEAFDRHLARAIDLGAARALVDEDMAAAAEQAGRALSARGELERARGAFDVAIAQWTALRDHERAERIRALSF